METSTSESGIFNTNSFQKIKRKGKPCIFSQKLSPNLTKYLFDFFYYRELYNLGSINLYFYQCFSDYQLLTWKIEMNNIIDIFHLEIKNYEEEVDDTLTKCISKKRTYNMSDHPGCFVRINKEGINIISLAYFDKSVKKNMNTLNKTGSRGPTGRDGSGRRCVRRGPRSARAWRAPGASRSWRRSGPPGSSGCIYA